MNDTQHQLRSINCTQCGAPLSLRGGHRVLSINCGYCGSVLDAKEEYKIVRQFREAKRPFSPIKIGMKGKLKGVEFTVIGTVEYRTPKYHTWVEHQLFSTTHGYAWLEYEGGHFVFSRRVRDRPLTRPVSKPKTSFKARGKTFKVYEHYNAVVNFVEGELTFVAEQGNKVSITEGINPPFIYAVEKTTKEEEYSFGEYLEPKEVYESFRLQGKPNKRHTVYAAQPFRPNGIVAGMSSAAKYFAPITILIALLITIFGNGKIILDTQVSPQQFLKGAYTRSFNVTDSDDLLRLQLYSNLNNAWSWFEIIVAQGQKELLSVTKQISYYSGYDGGERWSEGSQKASAYFKLPSPGAYTMYVSGEGGMGERGRRPQNKTLHIKIKEGVIVSRYFVVLAIFLSLAFLIRYGLKMRFEAKRWADRDDD